MSYRLRLELKQGLDKCTESQKRIFAKMYSHENLEKKCDDIVDCMPPDKLDWAIKQVSKPVKKNEC